MISAFGYLAFGYSKTEAGKATPVLNDVTFTVVVPPEPTTTILFMWKSEALTVNVIFFMPLRLLRGVRSTTYLPFWRVAEYVQV